MSFTPDPNEIGALWEKVSPKNGVYYTGKINGEAVVIFRNGNKRSDKAPDWRVLKPTPREQAAQPAAALLHLARLGRIDPLALTHAIRAV